LQQNAFSDADAFSSLEKTNGILHAILVFHEHAQALLQKEVPLSKILDLPVREDLARLPEAPNEAFSEPYQKVLDSLKEALTALAA
jgi:vacuolar-type H+-ATPase catalytic subunit A/Vma1